MRVGARDVLKIAVGRVAEIALPGLRREIDEARETAHSPRLKSAIVYSRLRRAHAKGDVDGVARALADYWQGGPGDKFHSHYADIRFKVFRETHAVVLERLAEMLKASGDHYVRLVEVGCGDGQVIVDSIKTLPMISERVGIDLVAAVIADARARWASCKDVSFVHAEGRSWLEAHPKPGTVLFTNGGVLEYFSPESMVELFKAVAAAPPALTVLVEPAAPDHDLTKQAESFVFGREYSFSHNYRARLDQAGFDVVSEEETEAYGVRMIMLIAALRRPDA